MTMKKSKTTKTRKVGGSIKSKNTKVFPKKVKVKSFRPRMYRMKINISKRNKNLKINLGSLNNSVSTNTIGSYIENKNKN